MTTLTTGAAELPEALRLADALRKMDEAKKHHPSGPCGQMMGCEQYRLIASGFTFGDLQSAADELCRLHVYCQELESQVIADCMTHGTGAQVEALQAQPAGAATPAAPAFRGLARRKLDDLIASGYTVNGFAIEKQSEDAPLRRGFITDGGFVGWWRDGMHQPPAAAQEPVHGDLLPPVGSRVFIRHGRDDDAHACTVTGYYAWGDLGGDKRLHRVFVRMVYEGTSTPQARMLCDCYPTAEAALAADTHPSPQPAVTAGAVDALCDSQYAAGMLLGWNLCTAGDEETFRKIRGQRMTAALAAQRATHQEDHK